MTSSAPTGFDKQCIHVGGLPSTSPSDAGDRCGNKRARLAQYANDAVEHAPAGECGGTRKSFPSGGVPFERYCDDAVVHCGSERQVRMVRDAIATRLAYLGLELRPKKTRIVYCKDADRRDDHEVTSFTLLGYNVSAPPG